MIGVVSDTHGLVRPEALAALAGASHVVHSGDVGDAAVLAALAAIAPVTAVRGNNDHGAFGASLPVRATLTLEGLAIHVVHDIAELAIDPASVAVVIAGHSHKPRAERVGGVLFLNPGSAGPRRFSLPVTVARLYADGHAEIVSLDAAVGPAAQRPRGRRP